MQWRKFDGKDYRKLRGRHNYLTISGRLVTIITIIRKWGVKSGIALFFMGGTYEYSIKQT
jgi:hypothetical protein